MIETSEMPGWCTKCRQAPCLCDICHGARWLVGPGPMGSTIRCLCNREPAPEPPATRLHAVPDRRYSDRLDS